VYSVVFEMWAVGEDIFLIQFSFEVIEDRENIIQRHLAEAFYEDTS
jgi:hypothetical protein